MRFICSDESLNSYGFWVLSAGIDTRKFEKNPVMLWNHSRSYGSKTDVLPIGQWKDLRIENGQLTAEAVFDEKDDFARTIAGKVKDGVLRSCSIGIRILATSSEEKYLKPGQTNETVTACELKEISICDIPANGNAVAVALYDHQDRLIALSDLSDPNLPTSLNKKDMKELLKALGLSENADEAAAVKAVQSLRERIDTLEKQQKETAEAALKELLDEAVRQRKITADKREAFASIGRTSGLAALREVFASMAEPIKPTQFINPQSQAPAQKFSDLSDDEKETMRQNDPDRYGRLFEAEYGFKPDLD